MEVTKEFLEEQEKEFDSCRANRIAMDAVTNNGISKCAENVEAKRSSRHAYSVSLEQGSATAQKQSGRCWMFAAMNVMRYDVIHNLNLKDFELSQNYPFFYDKLEKSNYFLENILKTLDEPTDGRLIAHLLSEPVGDGGQWDMFANLVRKYGMVPKEVMPETVASSASREMGFILTEMLRGDACTLRKAYQSGSSMEELQAKKSGMMSDVYRFLCICLGKPPKTFDFEITDKDGNFIRDWQITPQEFFDKYIGWDMDDYVSLINAPTADKPYHHSYSVKYLGNVVEGNIVRYLNLPVEDLKKAAIAQLKDGKPVWFGSDVGKNSIRDEGIMDLNVYDREALFDVKFPMTKADRLDYGQSAMTHAMVLMGVDLDDDGQPLRWRVENSWGKDVGKDGYFVMTDDWFNEYTYQVVVNKKYIPEEYVAEYAQDPVMLEPWDPMGSLAD